MWNIVKQGLALIIVGVIAYVIITTIYSTPSNIALFMLMGLGVALMIIGIITNIGKSSSISVGVINRAEFYGVVVAIVGYMVYLSTRIDQIMLTLMK